MNLLPKTIRIQIIMAFLVCFVFMAAIIAVNYKYFKSLSSSMQFFELAEELKSTILEMRRYEKNYFLYRQDFNFEENLTYSNQLALTLHREKENLSKTIGDGNYVNFVQSVQNYITLMAKLHQAPCDLVDCVYLQAQIRGIGQNLLLLADQLVVSERRDIDKLFKQIIPLPFISLLALVILLGFVFIFVGEKVIRPLARITRESEAVGRGAFQRITPYGDAKNEIHHLVNTINHMMDELEKRHEQLIQSRKIASIGTLAAGIAHEMNNPVNNISLIIETLIEDEELLSVEERRRLYQEAMDQADRTSEIVKNLLEFSRASHPKVERINLEELISKTSRLIRNELKLKNITFTRQALPDLPDVFLDRGGLQQVLLNLFLNAIHAMENGGELKVDIGFADPPVEIRIDIKDNGCGIPPEYLGQIFDPFFTTKKEGEGTGLGLSVSYNIIKKNGGRLEVQSEPGKGTCFSIFLPLVQNNFP